MALLCCFFKLEWSMCPVLVGAHQIQPCDGLPEAIQRDSKTLLTRGAIGRTRRAAAVLPRVTSKLPLRPLAQLISSHRNR